MSRRLANPALFTSVQLLGVLLLWSVPAGAHAQEEARLRIVAGPIQTNANGVQGAFWILHDDRGLASNGSGGACLVMRPTRLHATTSDRCRADADCSVAAYPSGAHAYCLDRAPDTGAGRCWVRPGPAARYCLQFKDAAAPVGQVLRFPRDATGTPSAVPDAQAGAWRVHACLNGVTALACAHPTSTDKQLDDGAPATYVPPPGT